MKQMAKRYEEAATPPKKIELKRVKLLYSWIIQEESNGSTSKKVL
jgi:hypothetical protein